MSVTWKIYGTCHHLIWSYADAQPYQVGDRIWCGPCNNDSHVKTIDTFTP